MVTALTDLATEVEDIEQQFKVRMRVHILGYARCDGLDFSVSCAIGKLTGCPCESCVQSLNCPVLGECVVPYLAVHLGPAHTPTVNIGCNSNLILVCGTQIVCYARNIQTGLLQSDS